MWVGAVTSQSGSVALGWMGAEGSGEAPREGRRDEGVRWARGFGGVGYA